MRLAVFGLAAIAAVCYGSDVIWHASEPITFPYEGETGELRNIVCSDDSFDETSLLFWRHDVQRGGVPSIDLHMDASGIGAKCIMEVYLGSSKEERPENLVNAVNDLSVRGTVQTMARRCYASAEGTLYDIDGARPATWTEARVSRDNCNSSAHLDPPTYHDFVCHSAATGVEVPIPSALMEVIEWALHTKLEAMLADTICDKLVNTSSAVMNGLVDKVNPFLARYLSTPLTPSSPFARDAHVLKEARRAGVRTIDWRETAIVKLIRRTVSLMRPDWLNAAVRAMTNETGSLSTSLDVPLPIFDTTMRVAGAIHEVSVSGLDTLTVFNPLNEISESTLRFSLGFKQIRFTLGATVQMELMDDSNLTGVPAVNETATIVVDIPDIQLDVSLLLAMSEEFASIQLGSFLENPAGCFLQWLFSAEVTGLNVTVSELLPPSIVGVHSPSIRKLFDLFTSTVWDAFGERMALAMPAALEMSVKPFLNSVLLEALASKVEKVCVPYQPPSRDDHLRFTGESLLPRMLARLHQMLHTASTIKAYAGKAGQALDEWAAAPSTHLDVNADLGSFGQLSFTMGDWRITPMDTVRNVNVLEPQGPYRLLNSLGLAGNSSLVLSFSMNLSLTDGLLGLRDDVEVSLSLEDLEFMNTDYVLMNGTRLLSRLLSNLMDPRCWLGILDDAAVEQLFLAIGLFNLTVACDSPASCTSPVMLNAPSRMQRPDAVHRMTSKVNSAMAQLLGAVMTPHAQEELRKYVLRSNVMCEGRVVPPGMLPADLQTDGHGAFVLGSTHTPELVLGVLVLYILLWLCSCTCVSDGMPDAATLGAQVPLYRDPAVSRWQRLSVLLAVALIAPLFVVGHFSTAAHVGVDFRFGGDAPGSTASLPLKQLSVVGSVVELWRYGAWPLALLIGLFSILWPYVKLAILAFCWVAPPRYFGLRWRRRLLEFLDSCGKWSLIDVYVMVLCMVTFSVHITNPDIVLAGRGDVYDIKLWVVPKVGLWCFLAAILVSLVVSTLSTLCNSAAAAAAATAAATAIATPACTHPLEPRRKCEDKNVLALGPCRQALSAHTWEVMLPSGKVCYVELHWLIRLLVSCALLLAGALLVFGAGSPAIGFTIRGLGGYLVQIMNPGARHVEHSFLSVLGALLDPDGLYARAPKVAGSVTACYAFFGLVVPMANVCVMCILWSAKLTVAAKRRLLFTVKLLKSWTALEIFIFAVTISLWQLSMLSRSIADEQCRSIQPFLELLVPLGLLDVDRCYEVVPEFVPGAFLLLTGGLLAYAMTLIVIGACERALVDLEGVSACISRPAPGLPRCSTRLGLWAGLLRARKQVGCAGVPATLASPLLPR